MIRKIIALAGLAMMASGGDCLGGYIIAGAGIALVAVAGLMKGEQR